MNFLLPFLFESRPNMSIAINSNGPPGGSNFKSCGCISCWQDYRHYWHFKHSSRYHFTSMVSSKNFCCNVYSSCFRMVKYRLVMFLYLASLHVEKTERHFMKPCLVRHVLKECWSRPKSSECRERPLLSKFAKLRSFLLHVHEGLYFQTLDFLTTIAYIDAVYFVRF